MAGADQNSLWDAPDQNVAGVERLSRMVAGNDHLIAEPGLVQALYENNATPQQAAAINQFLAGLNAEKKVRTAAAAGRQIYLSDTEQASLTAMGIPFQEVLKSRQDALAQLRQDMAKHGLEPVMDAAGQVQTNADGNPLAKPINWGVTPAEARQTPGAMGEIHGSGGGLLGEIANVVSNVAAPIEGAKAVGSGAARAFQWANTNVSKEFQGIRDAYTGGGMAGQQAEQIAPGGGQALESSQPQAKAWSQDKALMQHLGYDPNSFFDVQAFNSKGYAHRDLTPLIQAWDEAHPHGRFGWDGQQAVTAAELYAADPAKYNENIIKNTADPNAAAAQLEATSAPEFQDLVKRVNANRSDLGAMVAQGVGIDPVKHSTEFAWTAATTNLAASFIIDPTSIALSTYSGAQRTAVALKGLTDAEGIVRVLKPTARFVMPSQRHAISLVQDMVDSSTKIREAEAAGETVKAAQLHAALQGRNPLYGLIGDFTGENQIIRTMTDAESASREVDQLPFVYGKGAPIDTYDKAVDYFASKGALLRLQGGLAPIETTVMPGALSSAAYARLKSGLMSWSAGFSLKRGEAAAEKFVTAQTADPEKFKALVDDGFLTKTLAAPDDAVDVLSGKVLAAQQKVANATGAELDAAKQELASARRALADSVDMTPAGRGALRGNQLSFGRAAAAPKGAQGALDRLGAGTGNRLQNLRDNLVVMGYGTLGMAQRAKLVASRFLNWLPRDMTVDFESAASVDVIRKFARLYLTPGDTAMLVMRYVRGDVETRKTIFEGLEQQVFHAAGLTRTQAGRDLIDRVMSQKQKYATFGDDILDEAGTPVGLVPGQMVLRRKLPNFGAVHKASAKVGLYEGTMGRILSSTAMDRMVAGLWKIPILFTPVTAIRANAEAWLNALANGLFMDGVAGKALLRDAGKMSYKEVARSKPVDWLLSLAPLRDAGRFYRHVAKMPMDPEVAKYIRELPEDLQQRYIHEQLAGHYAMSIDPGGTGEASQIAEMGFRPVKATYENAKHVDAIAKRREGYEVTDEVDGVAGANLYAHNLGIWVNRAPEVAKAIIRRLEDPNLDAGEVVKALESGAARRWMQHSLFGKRFLNKDGKWVRATTPEEVKLGKTQWADKITTEFKELVTGRNADIQKKITDYIGTHGKAPDADWILENVKGLNRPQYLLKPVFHAAPVKTGPLARAGTYADAFIDAEGKLYKWLVERLIQRHSTTPLFAAAYGRARKDLESFKTVLMDNGMSDAAAERAVQDAAAHQAWHRVARMVDDPHLKSQIDVVGRGFFAFSRATTMMLRRWGTTLWRNPVVARRAQLAAEAAVHSGLVYQDPTTGDWMFAFPASGVAQEVIFHAMSHIPGLEGLAQFPTSDFEGRVSTIIPGSSNPFQYSTTPMVSLTGRWLANFFPEYRGLFDKADATLNGQLGQGQGVLATLEPTLLKKLTDAGWFGHDQDQGSMVASAMMGALYYLYAAGKVPPEGASDVEFEKFLGRLKTQTKSVLTVRALVGGFSPAVVSSPDSAAGLGPADAAFIAAGVKNLRDEFRTIVNDTGGDWGRALAIWTAMHPDETAFTQSISKSTVKDAVMPMTAQALHWMEQNSGFLNTYKSVAAYFMPEANGTFDTAAYRAQIEEGVRQYKTPMEFLKGLYYAQAASQYYPMEDQYRADVARAKAAGNTDLVTQYNNDWSAWSKDFKSRHPVFAKQLASYGANSLSADTQLGDLETMVKNGDVPGPPIVKQAVAGMIQAWKGYKDFRDAHPGGSNLNDAEKQAAFAQLQEYLQGVVKAVPQLTDLYNGVFRGLDNYLTPIQVTTGGAGG